ncbi:MAG: ABC transporter ATP-binding protein [Gemmatales bacterium]|nr:MAG: ABC transporter ATP-binding protein [Gemmatales bacterium]
MSIIELESLTRTYGKRRGIEALTLSVPDGCLFGFLGPNGAGKSTTIRVLIGLLKPTSGQARIFRKDCWSESHLLKAEVGYVPGDLRLYSWYNGAQLLHLTGLIRRRDVFATGRELADRFDFDLSVKVRRMSRGMRQKLGLILAMAHRPRLLILDEPTSGLDPLMQQQLHDLLREWAAAGHTVFFSSHTLSEVEQLCQRVAIVRDGKLVADKSLEELRLQAGHQVVIRWKRPPAIEHLPACFALEKNDGLTWLGTQKGSTEELIRWLNRFEVDDLIIERPDLETLFRRYYDKGQP